MSKDNIDANGYHIVKITMSLPLPLPLAASTCSSSSRNKENTIEKSHEQMCYLAPGTGATVALAKK